MSNFNRDIVTLEDLIYHHSTDKSYVVTLEEDTFEEEAERIYLPKSLVEKHETPTGFAFEMPEWLAEEKGLI